MSAKSYALQAVEEVLALVDLAEYSEDIFDKYRAFGRENPARLAEYLKPYFDPDPDAEERAKNTVLRIIDLEGRMVVSDLLADKANILQNSQNEDWLKSFSFHLKRCKEKINEDTKRM